MSHLDLHGEKFYTLEEAAKRLPLGVDFLTRSAKSGRLKAFKMDNDWYTSDQWLERFKARVRDDLSRDTATAKNDKWVRHSSPRRHPILKFLAWLFFFWLIGAFLFFRLLYRTAEKRRHCQD